MPMKVKNIRGTTDNTCQCGSWLEHWKKFGGGSIPDYCSESKCTSKPTAVAHVQKDSMTDSSWYIIPLCDMHNHTAASLTISDGARLVSANVSQTCGKRT